MSRRLCAPTPSCLVQFWAFAFQQFERARARENRALNYGDGTILHKRYLMEIITLARVFTSIIDIPIGYTGDKSQLRSQEKLELAAFSFLIRITFPKSAAFAQFGLGLKILGRRSI